MADTHESESTLGISEKIDPPTIKASFAAAIQDARARKKLVATVAGVAAATGIAGCEFPPLIGDPNAIPVKLPDILRRLVHRVTYGINAEEAALALDLGYEDYLEYHLDYEQINDSQLQARLNGFTTLNDSPAQRLQAIEDENQRSLEEFALATYLPAAYSKRQLYERMVAFWSNHFNIWFQSDAQEILKPIDDYEVIRPNALGNFPDLVSASAHSPSMLVYLDNVSSVAAAPNQNYARELMELHTLGVDNFSQQDVEEVSRVLTGWTVETNSDRSDFGRFRFSSFFHDDGAKTVLGRSIPAGGGQNDGEIVLDLLTRDSEISRITARFIGRKLAVEFWGYEPPEGLVQDIADAYMSTGGDIKAMVRVALREDWLEQAPLKVKRPFHFAISALRARPSNIEDVNAFNHVLRQMGHAPFHWPGPDGYPDDADYWGQYITPRWAFSALALHAEEEVPVDYSLLIDAETDADFLDLLDAIYFDSTMPPAHREAIAGFLGDYPENAHFRREAISLALASPYAQWY